MIDITNRFECGSGIEMGRTGSGEVVENYLPGATVVNAMNTLPASILAADPFVGNGRWVLFIFGNDKDANAIVSEIVITIGLTSIDLGTLAANPVRESS